MLDIVFRNGVIIDGTGRDRYIADVAISGNKIIKIGNIEEDAKRIINIEGCVLAPGFIDSHGHNDLAMLITRDNQFKLEQGVTTEVCGQCGTTVAPVSETHYAERNQKSLVAAIISNAEKRANYTSTKKWFDYIKEENQGTNHLIHVGQGTIRETVIGYENRVATDEELLEMKKLVREAMENGAVGLSSGLAYIPGNFTPHEEIIELCKVVAEYGGVYSTHLKNQGNDLEQYILNTIDVAEKSKCTTIVSHLKAIGKPNWGKIKSTISLMDEARKRGVPIYFDVYPYVAGSTTLTVTLPPSILSGGKSNVIDKLQKREVQEYIQEQFVRPQEKWENAIGNNGYESILIVKADNSPDACNLTIDKYAQKIKKSNWEAYIKLLIDNNLDVMTINFVMSEEDVVDAIRSPFGTIGTDGCYLPTEVSTHPRAVGTYPRYLGKYVRDEKILPLEKAIEKITSLPAEIYGIKDRGVICEGNYADITVFDYNEIIDEANFIDCFAKNKGIKYVMVNGKIVVEQGVYQHINEGILLIRE